MNTQLACRLPLLLLIIGFLLGTALAQTPGTLDTNFGTNGSTQINFSIFQANCTAMALQSNGKILLAGQYTTNGIGYLAFTRLNSNGSLDDTFGTLGKVTLSINNTSVNVVSLHVLSNGKIVVGGNSDSKPAILRLNSDGTTDNTFGTSGLVQFDGDFSGLVDLVVLPNGKMVGCGIADQGNGKLFAACRRNADGSADASFGTNGFAYANIGLQPSMTRMAIQTDGKILLTGTVYDNTSKFDLALFRFNANGTTDTGFGTNGVVRSVLSTNQAYEQGNAIAQQTDGKIVVAGRIANSGPTVFVIVRYNANGSIDTGFGTNGSTKINYYNSLDEAKGVAIQGDGKIVVAGTALNGSVREIALARLNKNGTLDTGFGSGGKTTTGIGTKVFGDLMAVQPDNKILVAGSATVSNINRFSVARYFAGSVLGTTAPDAGLQKLELYPNPVASGQVLSLRFELEESRNIQVQLVSLDGRLLHTFSQQPLTAGDHTLEFSVPDGLPAGQALVRIETESGTRMIPVLLQD